MAPGGPGSPSSVTQTLLCDPTSHQPSLGLPLTPSWYPARQPHCQQMKRSCGPCPFPPHSPPRWLSLPLPPRPFQGPVLRSLERRQLGAHAGGGGYRQHTEPGGQLCHRPPEAMLRNSGPCLSGTSRPRCGTGLSLNLGSTQPNSRLCRLLEPRFLEIQRLGIASTQSSRILESPMPRISDSES